MLCGAIKSWAKTFPQYRNVYMLEPYLKHFNKSHQPTEFNKASGKLSKNSSSVETLSDSLLKEVAELVKSSAQTLEANKQLKEFRLLCNHVGHVNEIEQQTDDEIAAYLGSLEYFLQFCEKFMNTLEQASQITDNKTCMLKMAEEHRLKLVSLLSIARP
jgi:ABC-type phosphate transport system auxiliary subunit